MWDDPLFRSYFETLARHFTVVRFDMRGNGVSDHQTPKIDLAAMTLDIETVIDSLRAERVIIYAQCFGGPPAVAYAAAHPERVERLILDGTFADGRRITTPDRQKRIVSTLRDLPEAGLAFMSYMTHPSPAPTKFRQTQLRAGAIDPPTAAHLYALSFRMDVSALLPRVKSPTLVLHRTRTRAIPFNLGRELASSIPNARFVALEGQAHNAWDENADAALRAVGDFLGVRIEPVAPRRAGRAQDAALTILFTDIESSTALTQRLGDARAQELLREHNEIVRAALKRHGGDEIKHTGDGIMACFSSASHAVECAVAVQRTLAARDGRSGPPLHVRIGLNAGEPVAEGDDLFGTAVQLARRVCDAGDPCDILVTNVVRELCAGKSFVFADRGVADLKGFDEPVRLYAVRWSDA
jgi:class 3 adenylate cyclase